MINIISNNCIGGALYRWFFEESFKNPFIWSLMFANDFIKCVNNYKNINFSNINMKIMTLNDDLYKLHQKNLDRKIIGFNVDNFFNLWYTHYLYDKNYTSPTVIGPDTYYYRNFEYVYNKYISRLKTMESYKGNTIVVCVAYEKQDWNKDKIIQLNSEYPTFIVTKYKELTQTNKNKYIVYNDLSDYDVWRTFYSNNLSQFKEFLKANKLL